MVIQYLSSLDDNNISIDMLTKKLTMLLALATADRASDILLYEVNFVTISESGAYVTKPKCGKSSKAGKQAFLPRLPEENQHMCVCRCLKCYTLNTTKFRTDKTNCQMMLSITNPIHPVGNSTISRWLVSIMHNAGIDTTKFKGHSTRLATTSAALQRGLSLQQI